MTTMRLMIYIIIFIISFISISQSLNIISKLINNNNHKNIRIVNDGRYHHNVIYLSSSIIDQQHNNNNHQFHSSTSIDKNTIGSHIHTFILKLSYSMEIVKRVTCKYLLQCMICLFIITHKIKPSFAKQQRHLNQQQHHYEHKILYNENNNKNLIDYSIDSSTDDDGNQYGDRHHQHDIRNHEHAIADVTSTVNDIDYHRLKYDNDEDRKTIIIAPTVATVSGMFKKKIKDAITPSISSLEASSSAVSTSILSSSPSSSIRFLWSPSSILKSIQRSQHHVSCQLINTIKESKQLSKTLQIKLLDVVTNTFADPCRELVKSWFTLVSSLQGKSDRWVVVSLE